MKNLEKFSGNVISKKEMKKIVGGDIDCTFSVNGGPTYTGSCASSNLEQCGNYAMTQAANLNAAAGYPGVSWECKQRNIE